MLELTREMTWDSFKKYCFEGGGAERLWNSTLLHFPQEQKPCIQVFEDNAQLWSQLYKTPFLSPHFSSSVSIPIQQAACPNPSPPPKSSILFPSFQKEHRFPDP